ncbi:hypothetical protein D3C72_1414390 [compost metagenome]
MISAIGLRPEFSVPFKEEIELDSRGIPSTTKSGLLPEFSEELPRTRILISPPGAPELEDTCTPAARPCKMEIGSCNVVFSISAAPTETIAPVRFRFF